MSFPGHLEAEEEGHESRAGEDQRLELGAGLATKQESEEGTAHDGGDVDDDGEHGKRIPEAPVTFQAHRGFLSDCQC